MSAEHRGVTVDAIRRVVAWLDSDQKPDAVVTHHGVSTRVGDFTVRITPTGPFRPDRAGTVLIFDVAEGVRVYDGVGAHRHLTNGIPPGERDALQALVEEVVPVLDAWNGLSERNESCSFQIDKLPGEGVQRAYDNYVPFKTRESVVGIGEGAVDGGQ